MLPCPVVTMTVTGSFFALDRLDELHPAELGHPQVGDDQAVRLLLEHRQAGGPVLRGIHLQSQTHLKEFLEGQAGVLEVLDHENPLSGRGRHERCR